MVKVDMDEKIAAAIQRLAEGNKEDWELMQHYIALKLIRTRDQQEITSSDKLGGYCQGLRFLFELYPRALAKIDGVKFERDKAIVGEEGFVVNPLVDEEEPVDYEQERRLNQKSP